MTDGDWAAEAYRQGRRDARRAFAAGVVVGVMLALALIRWFG